MHWTWPIVLCLVELVSINYSFAQLLNHSIFHIFCLFDLFFSGIPGLVVMREESCSEGCGFKSQHWILDGHFSHLFVVKIVMFVWTDIIKRKRDRGRPIFKCIFKKLPKHVWFRESLLHEITLAYNLVTAVSYTELIPFCKISHKLAI